jgi:hypothetical protein
MRRIRAERAALAFAQRLAEISAQLLGERLLSVILHGSLTLDDYVPRQSDRAGCLRALAVTARVSESISESLGA